MTFVLNNPRRLTLRLDVPPLEARVSQVRALQHILMTAGQQLDAAIGGATEGDITGVDHLGHSHALLGTWELS
jgi:hypothetical protein